jgi:predicted metal-dependent peptidase
VHKKIDTTISKLMLEKPYFGISATKLNLKENNNIKGISYYGDTLIYNSEYLDALSLDEVSSIIAGASLQQALYHKSRGKAKKSYIWNLASEYAINSLLVENGFKLHPLSNYSDEFNNLSAEEIYHILLNQLDINEEQEKRQKELEKENTTYLDEEINEFIEQIIQKLEDRGEIPKSLDRLIKEAKKPKISWRELLYNYINSHAKIDYTLYPSNKKHLYRGVALPSINSSELKIAIAVDTSASISQERLNEFFSEIEYIMQSFLNYQIELIECDYKIQNTTRLTPLMPIKKSLKGGGATNFEPVFKYLENLNEDFKFLIYFSDGNGTFPKKEPSIDTLWVLTKDNSTPFGEKIILNN